MMDRLPADRTQDVPQHRGRDKLAVKANHSRIPLGRSRQEPDDLTIKQIELSGVLHARRYRLSYEDQWDARQDLVIYALTLLRRNRTPIRAKEAKARASPILTAESIDAEADRIAHKYAMRRDRRRKRLISWHNCSAEAEDRLLQLPDPGLLPLDAAINNAKYTELTNALATLSNLDRELVIAHHQQGINLSDLAHRHGLSIAAVKTHLDRARRKLRKFLASTGDDTICEP